MGLRVQNQATSSNPCLLSTSSFEGDQIEREIVVVAHQLAFVNHKLQSKLETMKELIHEYEVSLATDEMMDCLDFPSPSGSPAIVPVEMALPTLPMLIPSPGSPDMNMVLDLHAIFLLLVQYDMFSWREDKFFARLGEKPRHAYT